ncbi:Golgi transport complex subunit 1 [Lobosporangium transversale]|nr:Golgi transport complex subunit 1 [Lobosporangium transversale]
MRETALEVQGNIAQMRNTCDIHTLKRSVAARTSKTQYNAMDDMKKSLYASAAQIKLLADVPEQIWRNIENSNYLTASRLYLISKAIYGNLSARIDDDHESVKIMETFPVVGRQWDAVSHFKVQILQKSQLHLKSAEETDLDVIETICAIMLLDDVTIKDMLQLFLIQREAAIREALEPRVEGRDIGAQIVKAIRVLQKTLFHIEHVFSESDQTLANDNTKPKSSLLERHLKNIQQTFSSASSSPNISSSTTVGTLHGALLSSQQKDKALAPSKLPHLTSSSSTASIIPKLYPTTPNIHLLVRHLPEAIQNFTPSINPEGPKAAFTQQEMLVEVQRWVEHIKAVLNNGFEALLHQVQSNTALVSIRSKIWKALSVDEFALLSTTRKSQFNEVCRTLLGEAVSIWSTVLRSGFAKAFQNNILFALDELSHQPEKLIRPRLGELDEESDPNHDIGRFVWNSVNIGKGSAPSKATQPLVRKINESVAGKTDLIAQVIRAFEETLMAIRTDQEQALVSPRIGSMSDDVADEDEADDDDEARYENLDLFGGRADTEELIDCYQRFCIECIKSYTRGLEKLVHEAVQKPEKARNTISAIDRAMTIGRVASGIASMDWVLHKALMPPRNASDFVRARATKVNVESQAQSLIAGLNKVYLISYEAWIEHMEWLLRRDIKHYLGESSWTDLTTLAWEPISSSNSTTTSASSRGPSVVSVPNKDPASTGIDDTTTLLPFHGSTRLISSLHHVVQEMHRAGTGFMKPELLQIVTVRLGRLILQGLNQFLDNVVSDPANTQAPSVSHVNAPRTDVTATTVLTEKGAMQMLFDVKFISLVFQSSLDRDNDLLQLTRSVLDRIRGHIDPINLAAFEKALETNADRQYGRVAVLLGLLVQLNPIESKRRTTFVEKSPHVFAMAPLSARFTLLPVGQKMTGRVV